MSFNPGGVNERLAKNVYHTGESHIVIDQELVRSTGTAKRIIAVCPAHVYREEADGTISAEFAACLECGACLAVAIPGALSWVYPEGGMGIEYREG